MEILSDVFRYQDAGLTQRLQLTHVCRHWRAVAIEDASLWTEIDIPCVSDPEKPLEPLFHLLETQLDRTKEMLLNVTWALSPIGSFNRHSIELFRRKEPISKWKFLCLEHLGDDGPVDIELAPTDTFHNLEHLRISGKLPLFILDTINRTTTTKLRVLDLTGLGTLPPSLNVCNLFTDVLGRTTWFCAPIWYRDFGELPENVIGVKAARCNLSPLPPVQAYVLKFCRIKPGSQLEFHHLTSLTVNRAIFIWEGCHAIFPALLYLRCALVHLEGSATLKAPNLEILHVGTEGFELSASVSDTIETLMQNPQLYLSPKDLLQLDTFSSPKAILSIMKRCPRVSHISLSFQNGDKALEVVEGIHTNGMDETSEHPTSAVAVEQLEEDSTTVVLCPNLSSIEFNFHWPISDISLLCNRAKALVASRRDLGADLVLYANWTQEGTFVPLE